jgi:Protein of unknown function (DUF1569)
MKSIFNQTGNAEVIERIDKLTASTPAVWGKMNVAQMLAHCQVFVEIPLDDVRLKRSFMGLVFGKIAKKKVLNDEPLPQKLPTSKKARINDSRDFEEEKAKLISLVKRFQKAGPEGLTKAPHPFFGKLTAAEWDKLNAKHLDHHLRQFGV